MLGTLPYVYFEGKVVPGERARVSIACHSLQYGISCFGGLRGYVRDGVIKVFRLEDHYERLMNAAKILSFDFFIPFEEFKGIIKTLIHKNKPKKDFYIRPFIFCPQERLAPRRPGLTFDLAIYFVEMHQYFDPAKGLRLQFSSWRKYSDNQISTKAKAGGAYLNSYLASSAALHDGYDDALMLDAEGFLVEASVANVLMVYRNQCFMPSLGSALLEGITMRTAIDLLQDGGYPIRFERIDRSMVYTCDELMLLGTAAQITFAASVDGRNIGFAGRESSPATPGPICLYLRERFASVLEGRHKRSKDWITVF